MTPILALWPVLATADPAAAERPDPPTHTPVTVEEVRWAQPFTLAEPTPWTMEQGHRPVDRGWLVELVAHPSLLQPKAVGQQVLFADTVPVRPLHAPLEASCTLVMVPGDLPTDDKLSTLHWYFGSTNLPERMDAAHGSWELQVAIDTGIQPLAPKTVAAAAAYGDLRELAEVAQARFKRCRAEVDLPDHEPNTH